MPLAIRCSPSTTRCGGTPPTRRRGSCPLWRRRAASSCCARSQSAFAGKIREPERLGRELRLEHVQIRELSAMMRRLLEQDDLAGAERLAANLARRWDAHTAREEKSLAGAGPGAGR